MELAVGHCSFGLYLLVGIWLLGRQTGPVWSAQQDSGMMDLFEASRSLWWLADALLVLLVQPRESFLLLVGL